MKIAMIEEDLSIRSGSRRFIYEATQRLEALGHEVRIYGSKMDKKLCFPELLRLQVDIVSTEDFSSSLLRRALGRNLDFYWAHARMEMEISRRIEEWQPDAVIFHYTGELWLPSYFYFLRQPVGAVFLHVFPRGVAPFNVRTLREKIDQRLIGLPPIGFWANRSLEKLGLVVAHSRFVYEKTVRLRIKGSTPRFDIIPLGVNDSEFYPTGEEEPFALCLARIHPQKNLELAVKAMEATDVNCSLVIAGDVEGRYVSYKEKLLRLAEEVGVSGRFQIVSAPTPVEIVRLLQRCSVFLFPSTKDTFGLSVLEAMACGKPIIACRAGGIPELLDDCGFLLNSVPEEWQRTLSNLLADRNLREQTGKKAFERSKLYSWDHTVQVLLENLEDLVSRAKNRSSKKLRV